MAGLVLTDASPLIGLAIVGGLDWLPPLFGRVWMPPQVRDEVLPGKAMRGETEIQRALDEGGLRLWLQPVQQLVLPDLDEAEATCIRIAVAHQQATGSAALLLIDERAGRAVAAEQRVRVAGTAALIGMAKRRGLITNARLAFEALHDSDFRISAELIRTVLAAVGEG